MLHACQKAKDDHLRWRSRQSTCHIEDKKDAPMHLINTLLVKHDTYVEYMKICMIMLRLWFHDK